MADRIEGAAALRDAAASLEMVSDTPRLDAELLLAHALGLTREQLLLRLPELSVPDSFTALVARRQQREPLAYITGEKEFWSLPIAVAPGVLVPRPDSELLIETALELAADQPPAQILDLGTGSGALLLAALSEFPAARGTGIDASADALAQAHNNADRLGLAERARFLLLDWRVEKWWHSLPKEFDLILANPPYIADDFPLMADVADHEPTAALFAGKEGLDDYRLLIPVLDQLLAPGGIALFEIGFDQRQAVTELARQAGFTSACRQDLSDHDRVVILRKIGAQ